MVGVDASCGVGVIWTITGVVKVPIGQLAPTVTGATGSASVAIFTTPGSELVVAAPTEMLTEPD